VPAAGGAAVGSEASEPQALVTSWWFDPGEAAEPYGATIRLTGRRVGARSNPKPTDTFVKHETLDNVVPGSGPVSLTSWVYKLQPGEWIVSAELTRSAPGPAGSRSGARGTVLPAAWSWRRWAISTREAAPVKTRWALLAPLAGQPAVLPGIYTALAVVGFVLALALQAAILSGRGVPVGPPLAASALASLLGLAGAKAWYAMLHPDESLLKPGWAVDGFLVVAPLAAAALLLASGQPIGVVFDATTPGIFLAVAIGRVGCFLSGCCAGRCTLSRWGIWSSDRRVGARRVPTQLIESAAGLVIAIVSLVAVLADVLPIAGAVFILAFAGYAVIRQMLLRLRSERRRSYRTLPITAAAAGAVTLTVAVLSLLRPG
jgi:phosphatidylglycerol:prolipoprotein diacylglycerol transferase